MWEYQLSTPLETSTQKYTFELTSAPPGGKVILEGFTVCVELHQTRTSTYLTGGCNPTIGDVTFDTIQCLKSLD